MTHDKIEKAERSLREIAKVNKKEYPEEVLKVPVTTKRESHLPRVVLQPGLWRLVSSFKPLRGKGEVRVFLE